MLDHYPLRRRAGTLKAHDTEITTICQECSVGCGLRAYIRDGAIIDLEGQEEHPVSRGRLCAKGIAFVQGLNHPDRLTQMAQRQDRQVAFQTPSDWDKAMDSLAEQLRKIRGRYGPKSLMIGCDPDAGLDFYLGAVRFARLWGTPHVYHPIYAPSGSPVRCDQDQPLPSSPDWIHSRCLVLMETDLATTHPVVFGQLLDAQERGAKIVVADTRFTPTMSKADMALRIKPETGNKIGVALLKILLEEGLCDRAAIDATFEQPERWRAAFEAVSLDGIKEITGMSLTELRGLARLLAGARPATLITGRRLANRPNHPVWLTLALAMNWHGLPGGGWYPVDSGLPPLDLFTDIDGQDRRDADEDSDPDETTATDMDESPAISEDPDQPVKAVICSGNCLRDFMMPLRAIAEHTELNVYFGAFPNDTWKMAHLVVPASLWPERENLSFSCDRAIQWGRRVLDPPDGCRSGLDFWTALAQRFGDVKHLEWKTYFPWKQEDGSSDERAFYQWVLDQSRFTAGVKLDDLPAAGERARTWPTPPDLERRDADPRDQNKIQPFIPSTAIQPVAPLGDPDLYPLSFQTSRVHTRSGDASSVWPWTRHLEDPAAVQIHPDTAQALEIANGDEILLRGPAAVIEGRAHLSRAVPPWLVWCAQKLGGNRAVVHKPGQDAEEAARILRVCLDPESLLGNSPLEGGRGV